MSKRYSRNLNRKVGAPTLIIFRPKKKKRKSLRQKKYWGHIKMPKCAWKDYFVFIEDAQNVVDSKGDGYFVDNCKTCSGYHVGKHNA